MLEVLLTIFERDIFLNMVEESIIEQELNFFLANCAKSSNNAIEELSKLLTGLEDISIREQSAKLLSKLISHIQDLDNGDAMKKYNFSLFEIEISLINNDTTTLKLIQLPSTFVPEDWSYTFFEGLSRYSFSDFNEKKLVELGCGNGWITIALAKRYCPEFIYGLDINPRAVLSAKMNLFINSIDNKGEFILENDGKSLIDKVEFHESDLLGYFNTENPINFDAILGCIPQVLAPTSEISETSISDSDNDELLHSLSNYTTEQGYIEDKFGLGLIAKTIEQSLDLIKPNGKVILNLGGRPGEAVIQKLITRRGYLLKKIWQRKVSQADDTEIDPLIKIENELGHHFEFYTDINSDQPINARTAKNYAKNGGKIYHNLSVYECIPEFYNETKQLFTQLKNEVFAEAKNGLDLHYNNPNKKEEKVRFLAELVQSLNDSKFFPYANNQGENNFRQRIAAFLNSYHHLSYTEEHILVGPNLECLVDNIINIYNPKSIFLNETLFNTFEKEVSTENLYCVPDCSTELDSLILKIKPEILIAKVTANKTFSFEALQKIIKVTEETSTRVILDISEHFELSSSPTANDVLKYIKMNGLPLHFSIVVELAQNKVYSNLQTCFIITENKDFLTLMTNAAEFSYSRTPIITQLYYATILTDLLKFQMSKMRGLKGSNKLQVEDSDFKNCFISETNHVKECFKHPAIQGNEFYIDDNTIRFDYGENELDCPEDLKISILESFTHQTFNQEDLDPKIQITQFVKQRFGIVNAKNIVYGNGVAPLFSGIIKIIKEENGTLIFPQGAYGYFAATALFYNIPIIEIPTNSSNNYLINSADVEKAIEGVNNPWLFINFPLVNPTGAFYTDNDLETILNCAGGNRVKYIFDTVFSGLEFNGVKASNIIQKHTDNIKYFLLGGISKEYSAGGIRFGYAVSNFANNLQEKILFTPHYTILYTVNRLLSKYLSKNDRIQESLNKQISTLKQRSILLEKVLTKNGWEVNNSDGGLFLVAKPTSLIGKTIDCKFSDNPVKIDADNITAVFHEKVNMLINNDAWTGIPGYCRFVLSVGEDTFTEGLKRINEFHNNL